MSNIDSLVNASAEHEKNVENATLSSFLETVSLIADVDQWEDQKERVTLMTIHSAKGLEFDSVFITGMEENLLPHKNGLESLNPETGIEEERRLCYVAITRARKNLFLSHTRRRFQWGSTTYSRKSRFIEEIPETLLSSGMNSVSRGSRGFSLQNAWASRAKPAPEKEPVDEFNQDVYEDFAEESQLPEFQMNVKPSDIVRHQKYGKGVVMKIDGFGPNADITVIFEKEGTKKLRAAYANLAKV